MNEIEKAVITSAKVIAARAEIDQWSDMEWTLNLITELGRLGHSLGFYICGNNCQAYGQGEWLYDLVWQKRDDHGNIVDVPLILESEWDVNVNNSEIDHDFRKLLVGRARTKVMVLQREDVQIVFERLKEQVRLFAMSQPEDRYLFLGWQYRRNGPNEWKIDSLSN